jgi:FMN-dependent NADH-azoreductase
MSKVLYIQASPMEDMSYSLAVAGEFINAYQQKNSGDHIETLNLFTTLLPTFDGHTVRSKYKIMHGQPCTPEESKAWQAVETVVKQFTSADKYVFAVPMWNFGIPYRLKQYIDIIVQPTYTFMVTPDGAYKGLITGKPVFVAYARGGDYSAPEAQSIDFQKNYLELILGFIGFTAIHSLIVQPTMAGGRETAEQKRNEAIAEAKKMAAQF